MDRATSNGSVGAASPRSIRVLRELDEVRGLRPAWQELQRCPQGDFEAFLARAERERARSRPHVLVLERAGQVRGLIAARVVEEDIRWRTGSVRLLRSRARVLRIEAGAVMGEFQLEAARDAIATLLASLTAGDADAAYLHQLERNSPLLAEARCQPGILWRDHFRRSVPGWTLELSGSFEDFLRERSHTVRKGIRRFASRLEREVAEARVVCLSEPRDLERIMAASTEIASRTYHERLGVAFRDDAPTRESVAHALGAGWFRAYLLYSGSRPIAFGHGLRYGTTFLARDTGFDPSYADFRPGIYLLVKTIEDQCKSGARSIDYGVMDAEYKRQLGTTRREFVSAYVFAPNLRGLALVVKRALTGGAERLARSTFGSERLRRWSRLVRAPGPA